MTKNKPKSVVDGAELGWLDRGVDPFRRLPADVLSGLLDRAQAGTDVADQQLVVALKELDFRRRHGFGLVWDSESPDNAERLHVPVKRAAGECGMSLTHGVIVDRVDDSNDSLYRVVGSNRDADGLECVVLQPWQPLTGNLPLPVVTVPVAAVSHVVHVPCDPESTVYPVLSHVDTISNSNCPDGAPAHVLIEGENFHALQALTATHTGKVDLIFIDPPYNTGSQNFVYNDKYVDVEDAYRHSRWLRFMERRLCLAKTLLTPTGAIFVAIDDNEQARLRLLMDQIFGAKNWVSTMISNGGRKNNSGFVSNGHDYMHVYMLDKKLAKDSGRKWRQPRLGEDLLRAAALECWETGHRNPVEATGLLKKWVKTNKKALSKGVAMYVNVDARVTTEGPWRSGDLSTPGGGGPRYDVAHPRTGLPVKVSSRGWGYGETEMARLVSEDRIYFGPDHQQGIRKKRYLSDAEGEVPTSATPLTVTSADTDDTTDGNVDVDTHVEPGDVTSFIQQDRSTAAKLLAAMIGVGSDGKPLFGYPKDHRVIANLIAAAAPKDGIILDFFAGSGSTLQAVAELNSTDNGTRTCILVTNNSGDINNRFVPNAGPTGICQQVTVPRVRALLETGWGTGNTRVDPLRQRCEWFQIDYLHGRSLEQNG